jgi:hypothetical protein
MKNRVSKEDVLDSLASPLIVAFGDRGITPSFLAERLKEEFEYKECLPPTKDHPKGRKLKTPAAMRIRQQARQDAHKLLDHYPAERKHITGNVDLRQGLNENDMEWLKVLKKELLERQETRQLRLTNDD